MKQYKDSVHYVEEAVLRLSGDKYMLAFTYLYWDVVVHGSRQSNWGSIVREGPEHMQVPGHGAQ